MEKIYSHFSSADGEVEISYYKVIPEDKSEGVIQIVHGMAEHKERYTHFADFLAENGYKVYICDHRGHGKSVNEKIPLGFFAEENGWDKLTEDSAKFTQIIEKENPGEKIFLLGHSMGSFVARTLMINYSDRYSAVILSGTGGYKKFMMTVAGKIVNSKIKKIGKKTYSEEINKLVFGGYNKKIKNSSTHFDWLSRNESVVKNYIDDPLCGFVPTAGFFGDMIYGMGYIFDKNNIKKIRKDINIILFSGEADPVGDYGHGIIQSVRIYKDAGIKNVDFKIYPQARHEILNEINNKEVYGDILNYIKKIG